jgi:hypothetical protein
VAQQRGLGRVRSLAEFTTGLGQQLRHHDGKRAGFARSPVVVGVKIVTQGLHQVGQRRQRVRPASLQHQRRGETRQQGPTRDGIVRKALRDGEQRRRSFGQRPQRRFEQSALRQLRLRGHQHLGGDVVPLAQRLGDAGAEFDSRRLRGQQHGQEQEPRSFQHSAGSHARHRRQPCRARRLGMARASLAAPLPVRNASRERRCPTGPATAAHAALLASA